ncbi:GNAT family N-acetyltransferase [Steroidobacter cummioxidans]|uniref:GNAT family N-acetyltransferase n=1 Tax=Steroidobacter cummioxidans TaxID=1803913 RepID=UPI000E32330F|nr:GNAT family N-acetyltransferase [Steroidobacter cummioxidans]
MSRVGIAGAEEIEARRSELAEILVDCVDNGASVSFMAPMSRQKAEAFWSGVAQQVRDGRCELLALTAEGRWVGTTILVTGLPENQPHRAEVSKVLVHSSMRGRGFGKLLMQSVETRAQALGKTLLVLDTVPEMTAYHLYRRMGWNEVGRVPGFALMPDGAPCDTAFFYKRLSGCQPF